MKNEKDFYKCIYFRLMYCSLEKDCWWYWLTFQWPQRRSSSEPSELLVNFIKNVHAEIPVNMLLGFAKLNIFWVSMYRFVRLVVVFWWTWHIFSVGRTCTVHAMHPGNQVLIQGALRVNLCLPNDMPRSWYMDHCTNDFSRGEGEGGMGVCFHRKFWSKIHYSRNIILTFSSSNITIKYDTPSTSLTTHQHANDYDRTSSTPSIFEIHARDLWDLLCGIR